MEVQNGKAKPQTQPVVHLAGVVCESGCRRKDGQGQEGLETEI